MHISENTVEAFIKWALILLFAIAFVFLGVVAYYGLDAALRSSPQEAAATVTSKHYQEPYTTIVFTLVGKTTVPITIFNPGTYHICTKIKGRNESVCGTIQAETWRNLSIDDSVTVSYSKGGLSGEAILENLSR